MKVSRILLFASIAILAACKIEITAPTSGAVDTLSEAYDCAAGQTCIVEVDDIFFDETFVAEPASGFVFKGWKKKFGSLCGNETGTCRVETSWAAGNPAFTALLEDPDLIVHLEPAFQSTGFKTLFTGNSFVAPMASGIPALATAAGIANHDHHAVTAGGENGAPENLWTNATKGPQIRGILDEGDVDLFTMTSLPGSMDGYRLWIDYALAENPATRIGINIPWVPYPGFRDTAEYEAQWDNYYANVLDDIDDLRIEYPGVDIFAIAYGRGAIELRKLFDAGNLDDVEIMTSSTADSIFNDTLGHADDIHRDLNRLIWLRVIYDIDLDAMAYDPGYNADLKAIAQDITDGQDEAYNAAYR